MRKFILVLIPFFFISCQLVKKEDDSEKNNITSKNIYKLINENFNFINNNQKLETLVNKEFKNPKPVSLIKSLNTNVYSFGFTSNDHYIILEDIKTKYLSLLIDSYNPITFPDKEKEGDHNISILNHKIEGLDAYFNESSIRYSLEVISLNQIDSIFRYALEVIDGTNFEVSSIKRIDLKDIPETIEIYQKEYLKNFGSKYYNFVSDYLQYLIKEYGKNRTVIYFNETKKRFYFFIIRTPNTNNSSLINVKQVYSKYFLKKYFFKIDCITFNSSRDSDIKF